MKKLALIAVAFVMTAATSFAGIDGSKHDFVDGASSANQFGNRICGPCHVPHNADKTTPPLWDHTETSATFTYYDLPGDKNDDPTSLDSYSKLCMSCHDGTVNLDAYNGATGTKKITGTALLGTSLANDHPVNVNLESTDTNYYTGYKAPTNALVTGSLSTVSCASCHDPHGGVTGTKLLRTSNVGSALCLDCHDK